METTVRKIGNSTGVILPARLLRALNIKEGDILDICVEKDSLVAKKISKTEAVFDLASLMQHTDFDAIKKDQETQDWNNMPSVGRELI